MVHVDYYPHCVVYLCNQHVQFVQDLEYSGLHLLMLMLVHHFRLSFLIRPYLPAWGVELGRLSSSCPVSSATPRDVRRNHCCCIRWGVLGPFQRLVGNSLHSAPVRNELAACFSVPGILAGQFPQSHGWYPRTHQHACGIDEASSRLAVP